MRRTRGTARPPGHRLRPDDRGRRRCGRVGLRSVPFARLRALPEMRRSAPPRHARRGLAGLGDAALRFACYVSR
ncbi:MAG: hypothetical protein ACK56I_13520, partial [bacterium]